MRVGTRGILAGLARVLGQPVRGRRLRRLVPIATKHVPRRIADHGIEAADTFGTAPLFPNTGKGNLPVEEAFFRDHPARVPKVIAHRARMARRATVKKALAAEGH